MKTLSIVAALAAMLSSSVSARAAEPDKYADPATCAIRLYGPAAELKDQAETHPASFVIIKGKGSLIWQVVVAERGLYQLALCYAADGPGGRVTVASPRAVITSSLDATKGFFVKAGHEQYGFPAWMFANYERIAVPGELLLTVGRNQVSLEIERPGGGVTYFRSLELLRASDREAADAEAAKAKRSRAKTDWLAWAGYGVMFHYTAQCVPQEGKQLPYAEAVKRFDVNAFADMVAETGASYVIFTANHTEPHFPGPLKEWEAVHPGSTTKRDLIGDIADKLKEHDIKLILYLDIGVLGNCPKATEQEFIDTAQKLIAAVGERYGTKIAGYWLDGFVGACEKYPNLPFQSFYEAGKKGNPDRITCFNSWIFPVETVWQDYWAGEVVVPGTPYVARVFEDGPGRGLQYHTLLALNGHWLHVRPDVALFDVKELAEHIRQCATRGSAVTINLGINQDGTIGARTLAYMKQLRKIVRGD